jgi:hypothetical protein
VMRFRLFFFTCKGLFSELPSSEPFMVFSAL